jgi:pimeloyl-ACP methyl ester carboxylesterase
VHDVFGTLAPLGLIGTDSPYAICGHSLGGRIALEYSHAVRTASSSFAPSDADGGGRSDALASEARRFRQPGQTWILDSVPGKADPSVHAVLRAVSSLPAPIPSRRWVVETLTGEPHVLDVSLARWIATNLREREEDDCGGIGWAFDLDVANDLVRNFADQDFVGMIRDLTADAPGDPSSSPISSSSSSSSSSSYSQCGDDDGPHSTTAVHLVMAGKSKSWTEDVVSELESIPSFSRGHSSSSSSSPPSSSFRMHKLDRAGHWVHVDDLEGLMALMVDGLQQGRPARG